MEGEATMSVARLDRTIRHTKPGQGGWRIGAGGMSIYEYGIHDEIRKSAWGESRAGGVPGVGSNDAPEGQQ